jgi:isopentenyl phosphate kinase
VLHGDVIAHRSRGATIVSGDELVVALAERLDATRVGLCSSVPGVLDASGGVVPSVTDFAAVEDIVEESETTDVTGGMSGKVRALLPLEMPAWIFDLEGLEAFLAGDSPGTKIG